MKIALDWQTALGVLALGSTLALSFPGIKVARADSDASLASAAQCSVPQQPHRTNSNIAAQIRRTIAERARQNRPADPVAGEAAQGEDRPRIVVLNNRGYNYGGEERVDVSALERAAVTGR